VGTAFPLPFAASVWSSRDFDPMLAFGELDALGERTKMVAVIATPSQTDTLARSARELAEHLRA
jgi:hypothetical protein